MENINCDAFDSHTVTLKYPKRDTSHLLYLWGHNWLIKPSFQVQKSKHNFIKLTHSHIWTQTPKIYLKTFFGALGWTCLYGTILGSKSSSDSASFTADTELGFRAPLTSPS